MTGAGVTVLLPTFNRRQFIPDVVAALSAQSHAGARFVLIDDGSTDGSLAAAEQAVGCDGRFRLLRTPNGGPAKARNVGLQQVCTEWVAFTDDDCVAEPGWLAALVATAEREGADVVQGCTIPDPNDRRDELPWYSRTLHIRAWTGRFQTCNLLVRTSLLREVGGFDERFPTPVGEDTDMGLRLLRAGAATAFAPDAVVRHRVLPMGFLEFVRRRYRWSQVVRLVAVNPDARSVFPHPYVAHRSHVAFWASVPITAWAVRSGHWMAPVAMTVAYGAVRAKKSAAKGRNPLIRTAWGATEVAGVAASCIGYLIESARHRRLLL